jgi:hypothetical protein
MKKRWKYFGAISLLIIHGSVLAQYDNWLTWPIERMDVLYAHLLAKQDWILVKSSEMDDAVTSLKENSWRALSSEEAGRIAEGDVVIRNDRKAYLIRGVSFRIAAGDYQIGYYDNDLLVTYHVFGPGPFPAYHEAIIVFLSEPPKHVFVTANFAR